MNVKNYDHYEEDKLITQAMASQPVGSEKHKAYMAWLRAYTANGSDPDVWAEKIGQAIKQNCHHHWEVASEVMELLGFSGIYTDEDFLQAGKKIVSNKIR